MPHFNKRGKLRYLVHACLATSMVLPIAVQAQQEQEVEEVVVTGSYIRNSAFANNSPVDTVTQEDLYESGAPSLSTYIRDLTYTQNTDVVANVLASSDGSQDATNASFNLRGLGENSTLSLVDGIRVYNPAINQSIPEIAIDRMELVLDGGSALYGSDAVAGVVNLIPIKEFEGFRMRSFYQQTDEKGMEDTTIAGLWGKSFNNGLSYVGALENKKRTPLMQYERTREWQQDYGSSTSGNPGVYRRVNNAAQDLRLYQFHGGTTTGGNLVDPSCGTFNDGYPAHSQGKYDTPSGVRVGSNCLFNYTKQFAYATETEDYNLYNSLTWEATDWLRFNATLYNNYTLNMGRTTSTTAVSGNNRGVLLVKANHPANPFGFDVVPYAWRLITEAYTHRPSHIEDSGGSRAFENHNSQNRLQLKAEYDISDTWTGYSYYSKQEVKNMNDSYSIHLGKLQSALFGVGGPNGNEYWNPFGSSDPRSPYFVAGVTDNSQELTDWLFDRDKNRVSSRNYLDIFETLATGEVFDLPAGPLQMAFGYQWRDVTQDSFANPFDAGGFDYNTVVGAPLPTDEHRVSEVRAAFVEFEVPILETLDAQLAVRHERFTDFGLDATTPKIALRWEALPTLAFRASWGESFLAPTPTQVRAYVKNENCGELFSGTDPFTNTTLIGGTVCSAGNPNLKPETSEIKNIGFTWQPEGMLDGLEVSVDYQEVEYVDRIRSLTSQDTVRFQFQTFLAQAGIAESAYTATPGSPSRVAAEAWLKQYALGSATAVDRYPDFTVQSVFTQSANISSVWIDLLDVKARYTFDTSDWGTFITTLQTTYYDTYDYQDLFGGRKEAAGHQNANTGIVPPLPEVKANLRLNWFRNNQSASVAANYWHHVLFDDTISVDAYGDGWIKPRDIEGETRVDVRYAIVFDDYFDSEFTLSAGVNNLFDRRPQRMPIQGGFESRLSTPWGRQFWVSVDWTPNF